MKSNFLELFQGHLIKLLTDFLALAQLVISTRLWVFGLNLFKILISFDLFHQPLVVFECHFCACVLIRLLFIRHLSFLDTHQHLRIAVFRVDSIVSRLLSTLACAPLRLFFDQVEVLEVGSVIHRNDAESHEQQA